MSTVNKRVDIKWIPGKMGAINLSAKHVASRKKLQELYSSAETPEPIAKALKDLDSAIAANLNWMLDSINDDLIQNPELIIQGEQYGARFYGTANGKYWERYVPLEPKASAVRSLLREYLN